MWQDLGTAVALLLVIEGIFPFVSPTGLRTTLRAVLEFSDSQLRVTGLASMLLGLLLLSLVK